MRYSLIAVAAASLAVAAPAGNQATSTSVAENVATDAAVATTPALDLSVLLEQLLAANGGAQLKTDMTQDEKEAMREIESIFAELREQLQAIEGKQQQPQAAVSRRQLEFLSSLPIVGPLLGSLLGGVTGGAGGAGGLLGGLDVGGTLGGLTSILGRTRPEDLSGEEKEMMREAEVLMENFLREVAKNNQGENTQQQGEKHAVQRRQLNILFGLPIVGPLLQSLLGGGLLGGVTGTVGGVTGGLTGGAGAGGALGGLTGTLGGTLGGLTGGGGAGGALGGLTGTLGGTLGGLTGGGGAGGALGGLTSTLGGITGELDLGSLLGKKPEDLHITEEQMAMAREADAILTEIAEQIEAEGRDQEMQN